MTEPGSAAAGAQVRPAVGRAFFRNPWLRFLARRSGRLLVSVWLLVTASFAMIHAIPGDPVRAALGTTAPVSLVEARREALGLNDPIVVQYLDFLGSVLRGDLGISTATGLPVAQVIGDRLPATVQLGVIAFVVTMALAVPLGVMVAVYTYGGRRRRTEVTFTTVTGMLDSIPGFLLGVGLVFVFAVTWPVLPAAGRGGPDAYVLPVAAMVVGPAASMARIVRVEALGVLGQDYIRTAWSKRLPPWLVYFRHALPNMLTSALTIGGMQLSGIIAGSVLIENIFAWPGLGQTMVTSIGQRDYSLVQGIVLVYGATVLMVNLVVDLLLGLIDPRSTIRES